MKWSQKVSLASGIGIATSSLLLGMGSYDAHACLPSQLTATMPTVELHDGAKDTTPTNMDGRDIQAKLETSMKRREIQTTSLALGGGIAFLVAARLFKRVRPFRLYATAAVLMLTIAPYNFFLLRRRSTASVENLGRESKTRCRLTYIRAAMTALAATLALVAKATA